MTTPTTFAALFESVKSALPDSSYFSIGAELTHRDKGDLSWQIHVDIDPVAFKAVVGHMPEDNEQRTPDMPTFADAWAATCCALGIASGDGVTVDDVDVTPDEPVDAIADWWDRADDRYTDATRGGPGVTAKECANAGWRAGWADAIGGIAPNTVCAGEFVGWWDDGGGVRFVSALNRTQYEHAKMGWAAGAKRAKELYCDIGQKLDVTV